MHRWIFLEPQEDAPLQPLQWKNMDSENAQGGSNVVGAEIKFIRSGMSRCEALMGWHIYSQKGNEPYGTPSWSALHASVSERFPPCSSTLLLLPISIIRIVSSSLESCVALDAEDTTSGYRCGADIATDGSPDRTYQ